MSFCAHSGNDWDKPNVPTTDIGTSTAHDFYISNLYAVANISLISIKLLNSREPYLIPSKKLKVLSVFLLFFLHHRHFVFRFLWKKNSTDIGSCFVFVCHLHRFNILFYYSASSHSIEILPTFCSGVIHQNEITCR